MLNNSYIKKMANTEMAARGLVISLLAAICFTALVWAQPEKAAQIPAKDQACSVSAITRPNFDAILAFPTPGIIENLPVKVGQKVKKGQILAELNDSVEKAQLQQLELDANNTLRVDAAKADLEQKILDLKRLEEAHKKAKASTKGELEHARLDVKIQQLTTELSVIQLKQAKLKCQEMKDRIGQMKIKSPCDGIVEIRFVEPGEAATPQTKVLRLVNIDPLWIEAPVPTGFAKKLKVGQAASVTTLDADKTDKKPLEGKITHVASVADSASETMTVRVELPNPTQQPAGQRVKILFKLSEN